MNPADWILDLDRSLNRCYQEAVGQLDLLFIENSEWIQRRKEATVIQKRKQEQIPKEEIERQKASEKILKEVKKRSVAKKEPLILVKKIEIKNAEKRKGNVQPTKIAKIPKKKKQSKRIPVVNNEKYIQDLPLNKKKQTRSAKINATAKLAEHIVTDSKNASASIAPENNPEAPLTISDNKSTEEDADPEEIKKPIETMVDDLILKEPSPVKLIPDLSTVHIPVISSPSIPTNKVESWMSQMMKKESLAPIHNSLLNESLLEPSKQEPVVQNFSPLKTEFIPEPKPLKLMPKQMSPEHRPATLPKPECYIESPLTRARRIDSQNIWREQQLSKFFVSRSEFLKSSLNALREVKEHERASLGHQVAREFPIVDTREKSAPEKGEEDEPHFQLEILSGPPTPRIPMRPIQREAPLQPPNVIPNASTREVKNVASPKKTLDINPSKETAPIEQKKMPLIESKMVETKHSVEELVINPTDVFRLVSPLKKKSRLEDLPSIDSSIEAEFVGAFNPPPIALVNDIDVPLDMEEVSKQLLDDDVFNMTRKEPSVSKVIDKEEEARRERLKERQRLAIERKNMLMKKAQDSKIPKLDDANIFKPKPMMQPFSRPCQQSGSNIARTGTGSTASALHKTAMLNSSKSLSIKTEIKAPPAKIKSPAPIKMAEKVLSSPTLPEIPSDDEEYLRKAAQNLGNRPEWAQTPALKAALQDQQMHSAGKVFQNIQPVRLEDIFKNKSFKRGRNSTIPFM